MASLLPIIAQLLTLNAGNPPGSQAFRIIPEADRVGINAGRGKPPSGVEQFYDVPVGRQQDFLATRVTFQHPGACTQLREFRSANGVRFAWREHGKLFVSIA
jgi:hypothetical protein